MLLVVGVTTAAGVLAIRRPSAVSPAQDPPLKPSATDDVRFEDGVLTRNHERWAIGTRDDRVVVGDWTCTGAPTPVLLRPSTGVLYAFSTWAAPDRDIAGEVVGRAPGAVELEASDPDGDGCPDLLARNADGVATVVRPDPTP